MTATAEPQTAVLGGKGWAGLSLGTVLVLGLLIATSPATWKLGLAGPVQASSAEPLWLYLWAPILLIAMTVAWLLPGLCGALWLGGHRQLGGLLLRAFLLSLSAQIGMMSVLHAVLPEPLDSRLLPGGFGLLSIALLLGLRVSGHYRSAHVPAWSPELLRRLALLLLCAWVLVSVGAPHLWWQDASGDGIEMIEMGRSLRWFALPRNLGGLLPLGVGVMPMAFPVHWFQFFLGPVPAAARAPAILYTTVLLAAMLALVETGRGKRLDMIDEWLLAGGLGAVVWTLAHNASYYAYFADLASPTAVALCTSVILVGTIFFAAQGSGWWFGSFAVLSLFARPTGLLVLVLLVVGGAWAWPSRRWQLVRWSAAALVTYAGLAAFYQFAYMPRHVSPDGVDNGISSVIVRFQYLTVTDPWRLGWVIVPAGIIPSVVFVMRGQLKGLVRVLMVVMVGYFGVFYIQAFVALHHFVPTMVLPLVAFWHSTATDAGKVWWRTAAAVGITAAILIAAPRHGEIHTRWQALGQETGFAVGRLDGTAEDYRRSVEASQLVFELFPPRWKTQSPGDTLVGAHQLWYYARHHPPNQDSLNYLVLPPGHPASVGWYQVAAAEHGTVWVRDTLEWAVDLLSPPPTDFRSSLYATQDQVLFRWLGIPAGEYDINLGTLPLIWRLFR